MRFATRISIRATPETVWLLLTDVARYPEWNTSVTRMEGAAELGKKITIYPKLAPGRGFPVRVTTLDAPKKMVWTGGAPLKLIFKGVRTYLVTPAGEGTVEFSMEEVFDGLFAGPISKSIPNMQHAFEEFASCLKATAEKS